MSRALYLLGEPGVGKSTVMTGLLTEGGWTPLEYERVCGLLRGHRLVDREGEPRGLYLGRLRPEFPGTDALGMAAHPDAVRWARSELVPPVVFGEGARLGTVGFLTALAAETDLTVVLLTADPEVTEERRRARGSNQNPAWVKGARTSAENAATGAEAAGVRVMRVDVTFAADREEVLDAVTHVWG